MTTASSRITKIGGGYPSSASICQMSYGAIFLLLL